MLFRVARSCRTPSFCAGRRGAERRLGRGVELPCGRPRSRESRAVDRHLGDWMRKVNAPPTSLGGPLESQGVEAGLEESRHEFGGVGLGHAVGR